MMLMSINSIAYAQTKAATGNLHVEFHDQYGDKIYDYKENLSTTEKMYFNQIVSDDAIVQSSYLSSCQFTDGTNHKTIMTIKNTGENKYNSFADSTLTFDISENIDIRCEVLSLASYRDREHKIDYSNTWADSKNQSTAWLNVNDIRYKGYKVAAGTNKDAPYLIRTPQEFASLINPVNSRNLANKFIKLESANGLLDFSAHEWVSANLTANNLDFEGNGTVIKGITAHKFVKTPQRAIISHMGSSTPDNNNNILETNIYTLGLFGSLKDINLRDLVIDNPHFIPDYNTQDLEYFYEDGKNINIMNVSHAIGTLAGYTDSVAISNVKTVSPLINTELEKFSIPAEINYFLAWSSSNLSVVGGVVGYAAERSFLKNIGAIGGEVSDMSSGKEDDVYITEEMGGVVGSMYRAALSNSYSQKTKLNSIYDVSQMKFVGGIAGYSSVFNPLSPRDNGMCIINAYSTADIKLVKKIVRDQIDYNAAGGIAGYIDDTVYNNYFEGSVDVRSHDGYQQDKQSYGTFGVHDVLMDEKNLPQVVIEQNFTNTEKNVYEYNSKNSNYVRYLWDNVSHDAFYDYEKSLATNSTDANAIKNSLNEHRAEALSVMVDHYKKHDPEFLSQDVDLYVNPWEDGTAQNNNYPVFGFENSPTCSESKKAGIYPDCYTVAPDEDAKPQPCNPPLTGTKPNCKEPSKPIDIYTSSTPKVASVDSKTGKITDRRVGKTTITKKTYLDGKLTSTKNTKYKVTLTKKFKVSFTDLKTINKKTNPTRAASIKWLGEKGIAKCVDKNGKNISKCAYNPKSPVSRGAMSEFLWKLIKTPDIILSGKQKDQPKHTKESFLGEKDMKALKTSKKASEQIRYWAINYLMNDGILTSCYDKDTVLCPLDQLMKSGSMSFDDNVYLPKTSVDRSTMAAWMFNLAVQSGVVKKDYKPNPLIFSKKFKDVSLKTPNHNAIWWLAEQEITLGTKTSKGLYYKPNDTVNRGSMAEFLQKLYKTLTA